MRLAAHLLEVDIAPEDFERQARTLAIRLPVGSTGDGERIEGRRAYAGRFKYVRRREAARGLAAYGRRGLCGF